MNLKELLEKRAAAYKAMTELRDLLVGDKAREWTAEERAKWDAVNKDYDSLTHQIEVQQRVEDVKRQQESRADRRPLPGREDRGAGHARDAAGGGEITEETRALAIQGWLREQRGMMLEERHEEACREVGLNPRSSQLRIDLYDTESRDRIAEHFRHRDQRSAIREAREAQSHLNLTAGAALVPQSFSNRFEIAMLQFGGMLQVAEVIRTDSGGDYPWPSTNDTGNKGRYLGENTTTTRKKIATGAQVLHAHKATSEEILVPSELLEDSSVNLLSVLPQMLGERLGRLMNQSMTVGTGAFSPTGIVTSAPVGKTAAAATAIAFEEIMETMHSVDMAYRGNARWMFHDQTALVLRKIKDGEGRFIWQGGLDSGVPDRLLGFPIVINNDMPLVASGLKPIIFGDLSAYKVRQVRTPRFYRMTERYRPDDQDGFVIFDRHDGLLIDAGTHPVKSLQMA